ncbi:MAG: cytochrome d ubiquinol oxidase subunit II [Anaerolineales bacterium]|nr:cytochrome d ubiquinol oxidase subunit II [Anaerolineales bacterium]
MDLNILWFVLIAVLYIGFFILEGFDYGVGILLPILGRGDNRSETDKKRRVIINTIGPHWDGNEVWLITAGGATFAAFPHWYATLFSGFYLPFLLLLVALILRGVAFEFRGKDDNPRWRHLWDWSIFTGSLVPAFLFGVAFGNLARGVPIDANMHYVGGFFNLLNPYALLSGVAMVLTFTLHGAIFLSLKTTDNLMIAARTIARRLWLIVIVVLIALFIGTYLSTDILAAIGVNPGVIPIAGSAAILICGYFIRRERDGWAFAMTAVTIAFATITVFAIMYPRVMISTLDPAYSLTIYNAASNPYTLRVMSIITLIFLPIVLIYQGWSYWIFRKRIEAKPEALTY